MTAGNMCSHFLVASRAVAKKNGTPTDRGFAVLGGSTKALDGYFFVESYEGKIVWEGKAHCRYCARAEAINHMAGEVPRSIEDCQDATDEMRAADGEDHELTQREIYQRGLVWVAP